MESGPTIVEHDGILVVREDLYEGGTKARYLAALFADANEVVYGSPAEGGAQTALATVANKLGKQATIFVARRARPHPRTFMAKRLGAKIVQIDPGYLNVVQARARSYCEETGASLAPFGMDVEAAYDVLPKVCQSLNLEPDEVWCAGSSCVLAKSLQIAWPRADLHVVQVGRDPLKSGIKNAVIHKQGRTFAQVARTRPPFPADPHYEAKAWEVCKREHGKGTILFWNVTGPAP